MAPKQGKSPFHFSRLSWILIITAAIVYFILMGWIEYSSAHGRFVNLSSAWGQVLLICAVPCVPFLLHAWLLIRNRRRTTVGARRIGWFLWLVPFTIIMIVFTIYSIDVLSMKYYNSGYNEEHELWNIFLDAIVIFIIGMPALRSFSLPYNWLSSIVLYFVYLTIFTPYTILAGYFLPAHRRLAFYLRPAPLPKLKRRTGGVTLIELLIVVAIIAIFSLGIANMTMGANRLRERQENWQHALALAQDEIALLRARPALPPPGRHPVEAELGKTYPFAKQAEIEVRPGPTDAVREVRVTVRPRGDANDKDVALAALLPTQVPPEVAR